MLLTGDQAISTGMGMGMHMMYETSSTADTKFEQSDEDILFYTVSDEELEASSGSRMGMGMVSEHTSRDTSSCYSPCC